MLKGVNMIIYDYYKDLKVNASMKKVITNENKIIDYA